MTNIENLNAYLEQKYPEDDKSYTYEDLRTAFVEGMKYLPTHPDTGGYCNTRIWHYVSDLVEVTHEVTHEVNGETITETITENVPDLPEFNKVCLVKFSDGTGSVSTRSKASKAKNQWITMYRDDIVAWSYYIINKINGNYI